MTHKIIACIDGSASSEAVCDWSAWASARLGAPLTLLHVLDKPSAVAKPDLSGVIGLGSREGLLEELTRLDEKREKVALLHGKEMLAEAKTRAEEDGATEIETLQRHGNLVETLAELEASARVVVIGRHGEQSGHQLSQIGSQLESVIRALHCPILVALPQFKAPENILLAFDGSPTAFQVLERMIASPLIQGLICHVVMVGHDKDGKLGEAEKRLLAAGVKTVIQSLEGDNISMLNSYAAEHNIDLIVMGAYGHSRIRRFFVGSNTSVMLRETRIPLVLMR